MKKAIITVAGMLFKTDGNKVFEKTRKQPFVSIRHLIFYYRYNKQKWTYEKIGKLFCLDHSTIIFGVRNFEKKMSVYKEDRLNYQRFEILLENQKPMMDVELLSEFIKENGKFLSDDLKNYLNVRL